MVGGTMDAVEMARPLLLAMGKNIVRCGDTGSGQVAKLCNNMLLAISMIGVSEAMTLGVRKCVSLAACATLPHRRPVPRAHHGHLCALPRTTAGSIRRS